MNRESVPILLVEDDYNDILLIQRAFRQAKVEQPVATVSNGDDAIAYLSRQGKYSDTEKYPVPFIVLLDLKLPRRSGLEVLNWIRQQPVLKRLLVVVLTSSSENSDLTKAYDIGVNSYLVKPVKFQDLVQLIESIDNYWLKLNQQPEIYS